MPHLMAPKMSQKSSTSSGEVSNSLSQSDEKLVKSPYCEMQCFANRIFHLARKHPAHRSMRDQPKDAAILKHFIIKHRGRKKTINIKARQTDLPFRSI
jgi:hypothetical protein